MTTKQQTGVKHFGKHGWKADTTAKTRKYVVMTMEGQSTKLYLGKRGAVRRGFTVAESWSVGSIDRLVRS